MMVAGIDSSHLRPTLVAHFGCKAYRFPVIVIVNKVDCLLDTMANKEYVRAAIAVEMKTLYRHLWVMGTSFVAVTVTLVKLLP